MQNICSLTGNFQTRLGIFPSDQNQEVQEMLERQWTWQKVGFREVTDMFSISNYVLNTLECTKYT